MALPGATVKGDGRYQLMLVLAAVCLVLDQVTKWLVEAFIPFNQGFNVIPGLFDLVHVRNRGAAFGFLNRPDIDWQFWLFLCATAVALGIILNTARTIRYDRPLFIGFGLIVGGALGNLIDRVRLRAVVDFLDFYVGVWHWPAFNVADIAICLGALLAGVAMWRLSPSEKKKG